MSSLYAAPFLSTVLADHGADVVKIEPPGGDSYRHVPTRLWSLVARGKQSLVVDLRTDEGCAQVRELVAAVDVVVVNMPARLLERRGLGWETLSAINPSLVMVVVSGFGLDGPYADRPGNGTLAEASAGLTHVTGDPDGPPVLPSTALGDAITGYIGAFGVLAACYRQRSGGGGALVDVNPVDAVLQMMGPVLAGYDVSGPPPGRLGSRLPGHVVRNVFQAGDGRWVVISASTPRHLRDLATTCGQQPDVPVAALEEAVRQWVSARPRNEVLEVLGGQRLPVAPVNDAADLLGDPHLTQRGAIRRVDTVENGPVFNPAPAPRFAGHGTTGGTRTPDLDEHAAPLFAPR